jgi:hypothetical protein
LTPLAAAFGRFHSARVALDEHRLAIGMEIVHRQTAMPVQRRTDGSRPVARTRVIDAQAGGRTPACTGPRLHVGVGRDQPPAIKQGLHLPVLSGRSLLRHQHLAVGLQFGQQASAVLAGPHGAYAPPRGAELGFEEVRVGHGRERGADLSVVIHSPPARLRGTELVEQLRERDLALYPGEAFRGRERDRRPRR